MRLSADGFSQYHIHLPGLAPKRIRLMRHEEAVSFERADHTDSGFLLTTARCIKKCLTGTGETNRIVSLSEKRLYCA